VSGSGQKPGSHRVIEKVKALDTNTGREVWVDKLLSFDKKGKRVKHFGFHQFCHSLSSFFTT
jgi:hypothetical protein